MASNHYRSLEMLCYNIPYDCWQQPCAARKLPKRASQALSPPSLANDVVAIGEPFILRLAIQAMLEDARPNALERLLCMEPCPAVWMRLSRERVSIVPIWSICCCRASSMVCSPAR